MKISSGHSSSECRSQRGTGTSACPDVNKEKGKYSKWIQQDAKVKKCIISSIDDSVLIQLVSCKTGKETQTL